MFQLPDGETEPCLIQQGYEYWLRQCDGQQIPSWSDIDPAAIKHLLPNIVVIHVSYNPLDFVERITGDVILSHSAENSMHRNWRNYEGRGPDSKIWKVMQDVVETGEASFQTIPYVGPQKYFKGINTVICPILGEGRKVTRLMSFVDYIMRSDSPLEKEIAQHHSSRFSNRPKGLVS